MKDELEENQQAEGNHRKEMETCIERRNQTKEKSDKLKKLIAEARKKLQKSVQEFGDDKELTEDPADLQA